MTRAMEDIQRPDVEVYAGTRANASIGAQPRDRKMVAAAAENGYTSEARGITADARSWGTARTKAREYADQHDPAKIAERTAQLNFTPKLLTDAFDKFFTAKCAGGTGEKSIANLTTPRNQLVEYVSQHNASQVEKIVYVHEITPEFLTDWMGTWKDRTHYSKGKKRKNVSAALDQAQPRRRYAQNLQADLTIGDSQDPIHSPADGGNRPRGS
jgi:hypothetical protein